MQIGESLCAGAVGAALVCMPLTATAFELTTALPGDDRFTGIATMANGDLVAVGSIDIEGDWHGRIVRLDGDGNVVWEQSMNVGDDWDRFSDVTALPDGGIVAVGTARVGGQDHGWAVKLRADGSFNWERTLGDIDRGLSSLASVVVDDDGSLVIGGYAAGEDGSGDDGWVVRLDANGLYVSQTKVHHEGQDEIKAITLLPDGAVAFAGQADATNERTGLVGVIDASGELAWKQAIGKGRGTAFWGIVALADGTLVTAGAARADNGDRNGLVVGLSADGEPVWNSFLPGDGTAALLDLASNRTDGLFKPAGLVGVGWTYANDSALQGWIIALDSAGAMTWQETFGGPGNGRFSAIAPLGDASLVAAGATDGEGPSNEEDGWILTLPATRE